MRLFLFVFIICGCIFAQSHGIDSRASNDVLLIDNLPQQNPGNLELEAVFSSIWFSAPVFLADAMDSSGRVFVVEKKGIIRSLPNRKNVIEEDASVFLDIQSSVRDSGEQGLLGLAFDPDYKNNGQFYVYYSWKQHNPGMSRVSRFTNHNPQGNTVDANTEEVILEVPQPYSNHNGGMIAFGPDNMLYIGLGDGGSGGDPLNNGQDTTSLLGNILRIDVRSTPEKGKKYNIPSDNPFLSKGPAGSLTCKEIYAYGLRNPWRFSFDKIHKHLFVADVGQNKIEEINVVVSGGNYGWRIMEGDNCFKTPNCNTKGLMRPIATYDRADGYSVTGGYVYYGKRVPSLYGMYIYGDYGSGNIWGLRYDGSEVEGPYLLVRSSGLNITSFGQDSDGEVYILDHSGGIYLFSSQERRNSFPTKLSEIPALHDSGLAKDQTDLGILPYEPVSPLWTDGMSKSRFIAIPHLEKVSFKQTGGWDFPENSIIVKNFVLSMDESNPEITTKQIETRLLYRKNDQWHGFSYEWNEEGTDATLLSGNKEKTYNILDKNGQHVVIKHLFPSRNQCIQCHTKTSNGLLGIQTNQLNSIFHYPKSGVKDNQMRTLEHIELFKSALPQPPKNLPQMPSPSDVSFSFEERARSYLATNCAMCHQANGTAPTDLDLRWGIGTSEMNAVNVEPQNNLGIPGAKIIFAGDPEKSVLFKRLSTRDHNQMPPLASSRVDEEAIKLIREWIKNIKSK